MVRYPINAKRRPSSGETSLLSEEEFTKDRGQVEAGAKCSDMSLNTLDFDQNAQQLLCSTKLAPAHLVAVRRIGLKVNHEFERCRSNDRPVLHHFSDFLSGERILGFMRIMSLTNPTLRAKLERMWQPPSPN